MSDVIESADELRRLYGEPGERARRKALKRLDRHCRRFIELSPFLVIGTADADGSADCSPRGDAPGFVQVLDDETLLIPDRPGNNRVDTMSNIVANPNVALIFFVPGINETLRVNGRARIVADEAVLGPMAVNGKAPKTGIFVTVDQVFLHCAKALIRSRLWNPETQVERSAYPSLGRILADQIDGVEAAEAESGIERGYRENLY